MCKDYGEEYNFSECGNTPIIEFTSRDEELKVLRMSVDTPFYVETGDEASGKRGGGEKCTNVTVIKETGLDSTDIENEALFQYRYKLECERRSPAPGKDRARAEIEFLHKDWDAGEQIQCHGTMVMSAMLPIMTVSRIRLCDAKTCMARKALLLATAPPCRWRAFKELVLLALACWMPNLIQILMPNITSVPRFPPRFSCIDVHGCLDLLQWAHRVFFGHLTSWRGHVWFKVGMEAGIAKFASGYETSTVAAARKCRARGLCPNRLWNVALQATYGVAELLPLTRMAIDHRNTAQDGNHLNCTEQLCLYSHENSTIVKQAHKCPLGTCESELRFPIKAVNNMFAKDLNSPGSSMFHKWCQSAWRTQPSSGSMTLCDPGDSYLAISHVWRDGTGGGMKDAGVVNECLFDFFAKLATDLDCVGLWWDAICIPTGRNEKKRAMNIMLANYERAAVTIVHDNELLEYEWRDDGSPAVAVVLSAWFTRGWTAAELFASKSHPVKVLFKNPIEGGPPVLKDLDTEILADSRPWQSSAVGCGGTGHEGLRSPPQQGHFVATSILRQLRKGETPPRLRDLLGLLRSRTTSWARDRLIIPGLMCLPLFQFDSTASIPEITQQLIKHYGEVEIRDLFHNEIPIAQHGPWSWCPPSVFDLGQTRDAFTNDPSMTCFINNDGILRCRLDVVQLLDEDLIIPCGSHSAVLSRTSVALANRGHCALLLDPWPKTGRGFGQLQFILVNPVGVDPPGTDGMPVLKCRWVGGVYLALASIAPPPVSGQLESVASGRRKRWHLTCEFGSDVNEDGEPLPSILMVEAGKSAEDAARDFKATPFILNDS
ncbi:hypothetical protein CHU98_g2749 [Xylaria longipes]|nr:hypothetical protein CHU98_g2749 [Xylaria longipes]